MRLWDIHPVDGTVIDPAGREAPIDPMSQEPRVPASATNKEPPTPGDYEVTRWENNAWEVVPDWRGHVYWTEDGKRHEITEIGVEPPADALDEKPPETIDKLAARKQAEINTARDIALAEGLPRDIAGEPDIVQTRPQDQINLLGLRAKAEAAIEQGITEPVMKFRGEQNVTRYLTPNEMYALTNDALAHIESIYDHSWERKDAIDEALKDNDRAAIEAVVW